MPFGLSRRSGEGPRRLRPRPMLGVRGSHHDRAAGRCGRRVHAVAESRVAGRRFPGAAGCAFRRTDCTAARCAGSLRTGSLRTGSLRTGSFRTGSFRTGSLRTGGGAGATAAEAGHSSWGSRAISVGGPARGHAAGAGWSDASHRVGPASRARFPILNALGRHCGASLPRCSRGTGRTAFGDTFRPARIRCAWSSGRRSSSRTRRDFDADRAAPGRRSTLHSVHTSAGRTRGPGCSALDPATRRWRAPSAVHPAERRGSGAASRDAGSGRAARSRGPGPHSGGARACPAAAASTGRDATGRTDGSGRRDAGETADQSLPRQRPERQGQAPRTRTGVGHRRVLPAEA